MCYFLIFIFISPVNHRVFDEGENIVKRPYLAVRKSQKFYPCMMGKKVQFKPISASSHIFMPVSYTHLDVYKRQVEVLVGPNLRKAVKDRALSPEKEHTAFVAVEPLHFRADIRADRRHIVRAVPEQARQRQERTCLFVDRVEGMLGRGRPGGVEDIYVEREDVIVVRFDHIA